MRYYKPENLQNQIIYMLINLGMKQVDIAKGLGLSKQLVNVIYWRCVRKFNSAVKYGNVYKRHTTQKG